MKLERALEELGFLSRECLSCEDLKEVCKALQRRKDPKTMKKVRKMWWKIKQRTCEMGFYLNGVMKNPLYYAKPELRDEFCFIAKFGHLSLTQSDFSSLYSGRWLSLELVCLYAHLLVRHESCVSVVDSITSMQLFDVNTQHKIAACATTKLYMPYTNGSHFILIVLDFVLGSITIYNSMTKCMVLEQSVVLSQIKKYFPGNWRITKPLAIMPQQKDGFNCGVFVLMCIEYLDPYRGNRGNIMKDILESSDDVSEICLMCNKISLDTSSCVVCQRKIHSACFYGASEGALLCPVCRQLSSDEKASLIGCRRMPQVSVENKPTEAAESYLCDVDTSIREPHTESEVDNTSYPSLPVVVKVAMDNNDPKKIPIPKSGSSGVVDVIEALVVMRSDCKQIETVDSSVAVVSVEKTPTEAAGSYLC